MGDMGWEVRVWDLAMAFFSFFLFLFALFRNEKGVYNCISNGSRHITTSTCITI